MPLDSLHLTLLLLGLHTRAEYERASQLFAASQHALRTAMDDFVAETKRKLPEGTDSKEPGTLLEIPFRRVAMFPSQRAVFAEPDPTHFTHGLVAHLARRLAATFKAGDPRNSASELWLKSQSYLRVPDNLTTIRAIKCVVSSDADLSDETFVPHVSILRLGRQRAGPHKVDAKALAPVQDLDLGRQAVGSLHLCQMGGDKTVWIRRFF